MSFRLLTSRLAKHGRYFLQTYYKRDIFTNILEQTNTRRRIPVNAVRSVPSISSNVSQLTTTKIQPSGIFRFGQHARKLFIDNILSRVTSTYSQELCNKATKKLFYGDSAPFFALVGVSLASGAGVLTKEDELEGVCYEIREAAVRLQNAWNDEDISNTIDKDFNIDNLNVGPAIAKGCAAVVYAASFKTDNDPPTFIKADITNLENINFEQRTANVHLQSPTEMMTPIQNISRFVHNFGGSVDNLHGYTQTSFSAAFHQDHSQQDEKKFDISESLNMRPSSQSSSFSGISSGMQGMEKLDTSNADIHRYPLALKMMFNYDIQSNALSILRAMYKETVPARYRSMNSSSEEWEQLLHNQTTPLPPHPNIVLMFGYFCGQVGNFPDGHILYPIAQPPRINPQGYGRNMSLYLLMKRYDQSLRNLLDTCQLSPRTKLLLFTQLLEGVVHIGRHGIAHRDLKSDNILIEQHIHDTEPILVLSDFGCCLADKIHGLKIPYTSYDTDKGGNAALMAPEIINKQPGPFSVLNYSKADLWACGAIAYEIFGLKNPFYSTSGLAIGEQTYSLRNNDYKQDDLPELTSDCPMLVQELIYNILNPNPSKRISPDIAANVMQLFLWAPSNWLKAGGMPSSPEVLQWLLSLSTKIMSEGRRSTKRNSFDYLSYNKSGRRTYVEYLLICSFLARARLRRIRGALSWIQGVVA